MLSLVELFGITLLAFLLLIAFMAVGVLLGRRAISGSCGGLGARQGDGGAESCSLCSNPDAACRELGRRMKASASVPDQDGQEKVAATSSRTVASSQTSDG